MAASIPIRRYIRDQALLIGDHLDLARQRRSTRTPLTSAIQTSGIRSSKLGTVQVGSVSPIRRAVEITFAFALAVLWPTPKAAQSWAVVMLGWKEGSERKFVWPRE